MGWKIEFHLNKSLGRNIKISFHQVTQQLIFWKRLVSINWNSIDATISRIIYKLNTDKS
jgi:hypothetical protein